MDYTNLRPNQDVDAQGLIYEIGSLYAYFLTKVHDIRKRRGKRYSLVTLLVLILLAKLGGEDKPSGIADWVAHRSQQLTEMKIIPSQRVPSHMTYRRVFQDLLNPEEFERLMSEYHQNRLATSEEIVLSMDGKALRGTILRGEIRGLHLLAIYVPEQGLVLAEAEVDRKENEIVVAPQLLKQVSLEGAIVIGDAMHTQREASAQIVEAGGDYIWTAKENQPRTHWAIQKLFVQEACNLHQGAPLSKDFQMVSTVSKGHGRIEKRTILTSTMLNDYLDWPHVAQVFRIERLVWHTQHKGKTREIVYGLTSLPPEKAKPGKLLSLLRQYWGIENGLHFRRDVTFHEDATRLTVGKAGHTMAIFNNLAIGLCLHHGFQNVAKARRLFNAQPQKALRLILETSPTL
jgi:predicted transposase YbfD/YdcC